MVISIALAVVTLTDTATLPIVYVLAALGGVALAFDAPGRQSLTFQMVGPRELPNAVALNSGLFNGSRVIGPAIAGLVIAAVGTGALLRRERRQLPRRPHRARASSATTSSIRSRRTAARPSSADLRASFVVRMERPAAATHPRRRHRRRDRRLQLPRPRAAARRRHAARRARGLRSPLRLLRARRARRRARRRRRSGARAGGSSLSAPPPSASSRSRSHPCRTPTSPAFVLFGIGIAFTLFTANANALVQLAAPDYLRGRLIGLYLFAFLGLAPVGGLLRRLARRGRRHRRSPSRVAGLTSLAAIGVANALAHARPGRPSHTPVAPPLPDRCTRRAQATGPASA